MLSVLRKLESALQGAAATRGEKSYRKYRDDPLGYMRDVLCKGGDGPWKAQEDIVNLLLQPPYRVLAKAATGVGKSWLGAALVSWFFDTRPENCAVITTGSKHLQVKQVLWGEIRRQRRAAGLGGFSKPIDPEMKTSEDHYAVGVTAEKIEGFKGHHLENMLFLIDEAVGVGPQTWLGVDSMFQATGKHFVLAMFNPTDTTSQAFMEEFKTASDGSPAWHTYPISSLNHPNVLAELAGKEAPHPGAVRLSTVQKWLVEWCDPIPPSDVDPSRGDFEFPPGSGCFYRPGPEMEANVLGRWPSQATYGVWSDHAWSQCVLPVPFVPDLGRIPEVGVDVAAHGADFTSIVSRWGRWALKAERHNGWGVDRTAGRLKELAGELADLTNVHLRTARKALITPQEIPIKIDADGMGSSVWDLRGHYRFIPVHGSGTPRQQSRSRNRRSELWFDVKEMAAHGLVNLSRLDAKTLALLRQRVMTPVWTLNSAGQRVVEAKEDTKKRIKGKSPDEADALNLAWTTADAGLAIPEALPNQEGPRRTEPNRADREQTRGFFGRGR